MYSDANALPVLRCGHCNKPFDKEATLKRHGYYCRSRKAGKALRSRSCLSCAKTKAGCDKRRPSCSKCFSRGTECRYPAGTSKDVDARARRSDNVENRTLSMGLVTPPTTESPLSSEVESTEAGQNGNSTEYIQDLPVLDADFVNLGSDVLDWQDAEMDFSGLLDQQFEERDLEGFSIPNNDTGSHRTIASGQELQPFLPPDISIPQPPRENIRLLVQRPKTKSSTERIAGLILQNLKSYPLMMMDNNALPPFIHPSLVDPAVDNPDMEPLTNCVSLMRMVSGGFKGARKLFWKNVRVECERLVHEIERLNKWELLAAIQALSIYLLIRLDEGQTEHNNYDMLLIRTITMVSSRFSLVDTVSPSHPGANDYTTEDSFKTWLFQESQRRICVVYRVINMLIFFEPAAMCNMKSDLIIAPLPGRRKLWHAPDRETWKAECDRDADPNACYGLLASGDLVRLENDRQAQRCDAVQLHMHADTASASRWIVDWKEWCASMDDFGGLVMLAASFLV